MQLIERVFPDNFDLYLLSDIHRGSILHHWNGFQEALDVIRKNKNNRVIFGGDLIEGICVDDKRFNVETQDMELATPIRQCKSIVKDLLPIKDQIVAIMEGNHEWKLQSHGNLIRDVICADLFGESEKQKFFGTYSLKLTAKDRKGRPNFKVFYTHGAGSVSSVADDPIRRDANMRLSLKRKLQNKFGDCVLMAMGHVHKLLVAPPTHELYLVDDGQRIKQRYTKPGGSDERIDPSLRWYACTGSFMKLFAMGATGYGERANYDPVQLGYVVVEVRDKRISNVRAVEL